MKRLAWVTDIHLDCLTIEQIQHFCQTLEEHCPDAVLIGGDIGDATSTPAFLKMLADELPCPIYFVLGNHDYYHGSVRVVREQITACSRQSEQLHWLPVASVVRLTNDTCLIGHGGWGDGRYGDFLNSSVMLNDYLLIEDLAGLDPVARLKVLNQLGDEAAEFLQDQIQSALADYQQVILLTHVPPFQEACWYQGTIADDNWLPHFSCKAVGERLLPLMANYPQCKMTVLCGHTHNSGVVTVLPNLKVKTGAAVYGQPSVQEILIVA